MTPDAQQPQREHPIDGADLKAIENFIYSTMNHTKEWELAENAYQRILTARSRPHTPAPEHKPLVGFEFNPACDCSVCQDEKAAWEQRAARTATLAETAPIKQVYERFKHLDALLSKRDPDCPMMMCYVDIWEAVKDSIRRQRAGEQE